MAKVGKELVKCDFSISVADLQKPLHQALGTLVAPQRLLQNIFKSMLTVHKGRFRYIHIAQESIQSLCTYNL